MDNYVLSAVRVQNKMQNIVLASGNKGKIIEIAAVLQQLPITLLPQTQFGVTDVEETGLSFVENALLKARNAAKATGLPAIADDSGLVVDALKGEPGIYSARYAGQPVDMTANMHKLLQALQHITQRQARFHCVIVYLKHAADPMPLICQGTWEGSILAAPAGIGGFGYDPIFYVPTHNCSAAELSLAEKNRISHRGQALQQLRSYIQLTSKW